MRKEVCKEQANENLFAYWTNASSLWPEHRQKTQFHMESRGTSCLVLPSVLSGNWLASVWISHLSKCDMVSVSCIILSSGTGMRTKVPPGSRRLVLDTHPRRTYWGCHSVALVQHYWQPMVTWYRWTERNEGQWECKVSPWLPSSVTGFYLHFHLTSFQKSGSGLDD
jgi:hypothetical protein